MALLFAASGCSDVDLGRCNLVDAQRIVYSVNGTPLTEGQALMHASCGQGAFCHSAAAKGRDRHGVPAGLNFDIFAVTDPGSAEDETDILRQGFSRTYDYRFENYEWIIDGTMPPGDIGQQLLDESPSYFYDDGSPLPKLDTREGQNRIRNWFACAPPLPIVERTTLHPDVNYVGFGDVVSPKPVEFPEPTWTAIYDVFERTGCNLSGCHSGRNPAAGLNFSDKDLAYEDLINQEAGSTGDGGACSDSGLVRVLPGDPDASLLLFKLEGRQDCGDTMPIGGSPLVEGILNPIREWITEGALDN